MAFSRIKAAIATLSVAFLVSPSTAVLVRNGAYAIQGTAENNRYIQLANQVRFDTVGNIQLANGFSSFNPSMAISNNCTGTLISANIILTAAHCFSDQRGGVTSFNANPGLSVMSIQAGKQVFFQEGSNLSTNTDATQGPVYTTSHINYALQVDKLSIYPGFDLSSSTITYGGDIALLRVSTFGAYNTAPTNYLPLATGNDATDIRLNFAVTIGYGIEGNGVTGGNLANPAVEKRAGLTQAVLDPSKPDIIKSEFLSPTKYAQNSYPTNFLQAAPGEGDSGGPLIINNAIYGVVQGGGDFYGDTNYWTRITQFASWVASESAVLGSAPIGVVSGSNPSNPLLPNSTSLVNGLSTKIFTFFANPSLATFLDPQTGDVVDISMADDGILLTAFYLDPHLSGQVAVWLFDSALANYVDMGLSATPGAWFTFAQPLSKFRLVGLGQQNDLTLGFSFDGAGTVNVSWTSQLAATAAVPEPNAWILMVLGFGAVGGNLRRTRRLAMSPLDRKTRVTGRAGDVRPADVPSPYAMTGLNDRPTGFIQLP